MHYKNIKRLVKKQIKKDYPDWKDLSKKEKKSLAQEICEAIIDDYDFNQEIDVPIEELLGIESQTLPKTSPMLNDFGEFRNKIISNDIFSLEEMKKYVDDFYGNSLFDPKNLIKLRVNIKDKQLKYIDSLLDDSIINSLLSYDGYSPSMREYFPSQYFRAELLKALKYSEISYRKYCTKEYLGLERKQNREFIGLPLHKKKMIDHTQLSKFRTSLSFSQVVNLWVYILHLVSRSGILDNCGIHCVDSTELANDNIRPLFSTEIKGKKIRIYKDIECDSGLRRNKRDKSLFFIGYRMHTLTAIDSNTGHSFPLISLIASANHHDSLFLKPLIQLAQSMGLELKLISADEAYHDNDASIFDETGVRLITPPSSNVKLPKYVDPESKKVTLDEFCDIPMAHIGCFEEGHEFKCDAGAGECFWAESCTQSRIIPTDNGVFQRMLYDNEEVQEAIDTRKNAERPFNLLKHREGLEQVRVRSQKALITKCAIGTMATLLIEVERRCNEQKNDPQMNLFKTAS